MVDLQGRFSLGAFFVAGFGLAVYPYQGNIPRLAIAALFFVCAAQSRAHGPRERDVAQRIDAALAKALPQSQPASTDGATFLRRISIDLTGRLPEPDEVARFVSDRDAEKRAK